MIACLDFRSLAALAAIAGFAAGCGDDAPADTTATGTGTTTATADSDDSGSAPTTGGADADGTAGDATTGGGTSTGDAETTAVADDSGTDSGDSESETTGPPNFAPVAHHDGYAILLGTAELVEDADGGVLGNDTDPEDDPLTVSDHDAVSAQGGTVVVEADGAFTYTAPVDYWGEDSFSYTIDDGMGNEAVGVVNIAVAPTTVSLADPGSGHYGFRIDGAVAGIDVGDAAVNAGDVNGDGLDDVLVSSLDAAGGAGQVWLVYGQDTGGVVDLGDVTLGMGGFVITGDTVGADFGASLGGGGDFNGDGLADIVIGAPGAGIAGEAYIVLGKADGGEVEMGDIAMGNGGFVLAGTLVGDDAGTAVAMVGDVNGDGLADVAIGAPHAGNVPEAGRTYVVHGTTQTDAIALSDILAGTGGFVANGVGIDDLSGSSLGGGGDVDGDGLDDLVIGAPQADPGGGNSGAAYVVFGKTDTAAVSLSNPGDAAFVIEGAEGVDVAGGAVAMAGDVNGDGRADVLIGASGAADDLVFQGQAYVVFGKNNADTVLLGEVLDGDGGFGIDGEFAGHVLGLAVAGAGDLNADGFSDLVLGGPNVDVAGINSGRAHVVFGKASGTRVELVEVSTGAGGFAVDGESAQDIAGISVGGGGDVNGDGYPDIIVAAQGTDDGANNAGSVYVVFGAAWTGAVAYVGGSGADTFLGTPDGEGMVAGQGDDILGSRGGADVLYSGNGDDTVALDGGQFFRIDAGGGQDTLALADEDVVLNLTVIPNNAVVDIEIIDLTGTGDNQVMMLADDVRALAGPSKGVQITGDAGDAVDIDLTGGAWAADGTMDGFDRYTDGVHLLEVSTDLDGAVAL